MSLSQSISIRTIFLCLLFMFTGLVAHGQDKFDPSVINWPTGASGCMYEPGSNTCVVPSGGTAYNVTPSGDTTCATDDTNIQTLLTAGTPVILAPGTYYANSLTMSTPDSIIGTGTSGTIFNMCSPTSRFLTASYSVAGGSVANNLAVVRGFSVQPKSGVTPTAGGGFLIGSGTAGQYTIGFHLEDVSMKSLWGCIHLQTGAISNWLVNNYCSTSQSGGEGALYLDTATPGGDLHVDGLEASGLNTGVIINQSDTMEISHLKLNGSNVTFLGGGSTNRMRFVDSSIEGITSGPTSCWDFGTGATITNIQIVGGGCGLSPITSVFGHLSNVTNLVYALDNYASGFTESWFSNWANAAQACPTGFQAFDNFSGVNGTPLQAHLNNCSQVWANYGYLDGDTGNMQLNNNSAILLGSTASDYYLSMTPSSANYTASIICNNTASGNVCKVGTRYSTSAYTGYVLVWIEGTGIQIYKAPAGSPCSSTASLSSGVHTLSIQATGTSGTVTVNGYVDGSSTPSVTCSDSSSPYYSAGVPIIGLSSSASAQIYLFTVQ